MSRYADVLNLLLQLPTDPLDTPEVIRDCIAEGIVDLPAKMFAHAIPGNQDWFAFVHKPYLGSSRVDPNLYATLRIAGRVENGLEDKFFDTTYAYQDLVMMERKTVTTTAQQVDGVTALVNTIQRVSARLNSIGPKTMGLQMINGWDYRRLSLKDFITYQVMT